MYACPNCSAGLRYDIPSGQLKCDHCGQLTDIESQGDRASTIFTCSQCGGEIFTQEDDLTGHCSYCGSYQVFEKRLASIQPPRMILPFRRPADESKRAYKAAASKAFFAPRELKSDEYINDIRGIYMPYWFQQVTYDKEFTLNTQDKARLTGSKRDVIETDSYRSFCKFEAVYNSMGGDASSWYSDEISDQIMPYNLDESLLPFSPAYLCGFYGEAADLDAEAAFASFTANEKPQNMTYSEMKRAEEEKKRSKYKNPMYEVRPELKSHIRKLIDSRLGSKYVVGTTDHITKPDSVTYQMNLLPVWFLSNKRGNRVNYATINGQTGKLYAEFPVDLKKFFFCTAGLTALLFLLLNSFWIMRAEVSAAIAALFAAAAMGFVRFDLTEIVRKEYALAAPNVRSYYTKPKRPQGSPISAVWYIFLAVLLLVVFQENRGALERSPRGFIFWLPTVVTFCCIVYAAINLADILEVDKLRRRLCVKLFPTHLLAMAAILIAFVIQVFHPVSDYVYYGVSFICLGMTIASLVCVILAHNQMTTRKLHQFTHEGGDNHAK